MATRERSGLVRRVVGSVTDRVSDEPRFNAEGEEIGRITKYSDTLLIFLLKGLMPDTFRERHTHAVAVGGEVDLNVKVSPAVERLIHNTTHQIIEQ